MFGAGREWSRRLLAFTAAILFVTACSGARKPPSPTATVAPSPTPEGSPRISGYSVPYHRVDPSAAGRGYAAYVVDQDVELTVMVVAMYRLEARVQYFEPGVL